MKKFLRLKQVYDLTGLKKTTVWRLRRKGRFPKPVETPGGRGDKQGILLFNEDEILAWMEEHRIAS